MENTYLKLSNYDVFSQKIIPRPSSFNLKCRKIINYYPKTTKFADRTHSGFYSTKNIFSNKINNFTSCQNFNIFSNKPQTPKLKKISKLKPQSASYKNYKNSFPDVKNNLSRSMASNFCLEAEKLFQETYQMKKVIRQLQKQLDKVSEENYRRDRQINEKEKEINKIILSNIQINNEEDKNNNFIEKQNTAMGILIFKIKREIKSTINEIKNENIKLEQIKKNFYLTKSKELSVETNLYNEQIKKIKVLIENALEIKEQNDYKNKDIESMKENIQRQELILKNLMRDNIALENKQELLNNKLGKLQIDLKLKIEKARKNDNELNILSLKNKNLSNDKLIKKQIYTQKKDGIPISLKTLYTSKVSSLKKSINFYKRQIKHTEEILNKLKEQKKKLIDSNKNIQQKIKFDSNFINNTSKLKHFQRPQSSYNYIVNSEEQKTIDNLRKEFKKEREEELMLEKKANIYYNKLKEINVIFEEKENEKKIEEEKKGQNQLEFGIDETNPYYTENEENIPESNIKFTSQQFNQFTYILFKNFEAKNIIGKEATKKVINPFSEIIQKNNYTKITYPSNEFDEIVEHLTKIIMQVLNSENEYNHTLTKIFIGALLYNSEFDINKLIEYFSILFSYTKDYSSEEKKYINKLKTKYKKETKKLVECITSFILNDISSSQYFSLFKMKDLLDNNEINIKDKYIEFLFYFLKKYNDPEAKLEDLKFSLLNEIVPLGDTTVHSKAFLNKEEENGNIDLDNLDNIENMENIDNKKDEFDNGDIINIEENKEINYDLDKSDENNNKNGDIINDEINNENNIKTYKTNKSDKNKEENIFQKNKNKISKQQNSSFNKAKQESKKDNDINNIDNNDISSHKEKEKESSINKEKRKNKDLFESEEKEKEKEENNSENNESNINNNPKINDNEDIKENGENNDSDYLGDNIKDIKDIDVNNINEQKEKSKEKENSNNNMNKNINNDINIDSNPINQKEEKIEKKENTNNNGQKESRSNININNISTEKIINQQKKETSKENKKEQSDIKIEEEENNTNNNNINNNDNGQNSNGQNNNQNNKSAEEHNKEDETDGESVTEITNEDFIKYIKESLNSIVKALEENNLQFLNFIEENMNEIKINEEKYKCINIEDLNDKLIGINVILSDMQLSCLCSKFSLPNELRLIDVKNFENGLNDFKAGNLKL